MFSGYSPQRPMQLLSLTIPRKPPSPCAPIRSVCLLNALITLYNFQVYLLPRPGHRQ